MSSMTYLELPRVLVRVNCKIYNSSKNIENLLFSLVFTFLDLETTLNVKVSYFL